jgi:hypothetical protein
MGILDGQRIVSIDVFQRKARRVNEARKTLPNDKTSASESTSDIIYKREFHQSRHGNIRPVHMPRSDDMVGILHRGSGEYQITSAQLPDIEVAWRISTTHGTIYYDGYSDYFYSRVEVALDPLARSQISAVIVDKLLEIAGVDNNIRIVRPGHEDEYL